MQSTKKLFTTNCIKEKYSFFFSLLFVRWRFTSIILRFDIWSNNNNFHNKHTNAHQRIQCRRNVKRHIYELTKTIGIQYEMNCDTGNFIFVFLLLLIWAILFPLYFELRKNFSEMIWNKKPSKCFPFLFHFIYYNLIFLQWFHLEGKKHFDSLFYLRENWRRTMF